MSASDIGDTGAVASIAGALRTSNAVVVAARITEHTVLDQARILAEAIRQMRPLATAGSRAAAQAIRAVRDGTALRNGLRVETCKRLVTTGRGLDSLVSGANPNGKAAEIVAAADYRALHSGENPRMMNPPERLATNVHDIRLSPDHAGRKDLVFQFRTKRGMVISKPNGQVKTGSAQYVADSLVEMAETRGYGKVGYVDSRFVNPDGMPRVASDAFTQAQAERLQKAKVQLRGIRDLDTRAGQLRENIAKYGKDGLDPVSRAQLERLRDDIALAYEPTSVVARVATGAALAATTAAVVMLVAQAISGSEVDIWIAAEAAGKAALFGAGGVVADAAIYRVAREAGLAPETAKGFAQNAVAAGFCLVAVAADLFAEVTAARRGDISVASAVAGTSAKAALDILPLALASLGAAGIPILIGAQLAGRWFIAKRRDEDRRLEIVIEEQRAAGQNLHLRLDGIDRLLHEVRADCRETDALFARAMGCSPVPNLQIVR